MSVHPHGRRFSEPKWRREPSPRRIPMASSHTRPVEPGQIHVQAAHGGFVLLDAGRCEPLSRLCPKSAAAAPATDCAQPQCDTNALGTQERCPEPRNRKARERSHITHKSQPEHQHNAVIPWSSNSARTNFTPSQRAATQLRSNGIQSGCSSCA
jgi:hypothetical protein